MRILPFDICRLIGRYQLKVREVRPLRRNVRPLYNIPRIRSPRLCLRPDVIGLCQIRTVYVNRCPVPAVLRRTKSHRDACDLTGNIGDQHVRRGTVSMRDEYAFRDHRPRAFRHQHAVVHETDLFLLLFHRSFCRNSACCLILLSFWRLHLRSRRKQCRTQCKHRRKRSGPLEPQTLHDLSPFLPPGQFQLPVRVTRSPLLRNFPPSPQQKDRGFSSF